jgi:hypothetical protein
MNDIRRRLNEAKKRLNIGKEQTVVIIKSYGVREDVELPERAEEWLTYPEAVEKSHTQNRIIVLVEREEIAALEKQQKATKDNELAKV